MVPNVEIFGEHFKKFNKIRGGVKLTFKLSKTWITGFAIVWITNCLDYVIWISRHQGDSYI